MTKTIIAVLAVMMFAGLAMADDSGAARWHNNPYFQRYLQHDHNYDYDQASKMKTPLGVEAEVDIYKHELYTVPVTYGTRTAYDFNNGNWEAFAKVKVDLTGMWK